MVLDTPLEFGNCCFLSSIEFKPKDRVTSELTSIDAKAELFEISAWVSIS
jgi:hypothetical protein